MLRDAELAAASGRTAPGQVARFDPDRHGRKAEHDALLRDLRWAIAHDEGLRLVYQPIIDIDTTGLHAVEALARWRHPVRGDVPPSEFVPLAEDSGEVIPFGSWVAETAIRQTAVWCRDYPATRSRCI